MSVHIEQFAVDKELNHLIEEGIAPVYIRRFHALQGRKIWRVDKNLSDLKGSKLCDLIDGFGIRWEVKNDKAAFRTGNVYVERQAFQSSEADYYLFLVGIGYVVPKTALAHEFSRQPALTPGGDDLRSMGLLLPLERLEEISEQVIVL
jgi:hypothetical protein